MKRKQRERTKRTAPPGRPGPPDRLPLWKGLLTAGLAISIFFGLLEGALHLAGVRQLFAEEDPFVGFVGGSPLFVVGTGPNGERVRETAANKRLFNAQSFPVDKAEGTYRIFCLGGSTTYGRPYDDTVSFSGWLRELLPLADPGRRWEVINCGGVSYASYRVARLMEELAGYEPDLVVVYSGHNEFLEERSYRGLRRVPAPVRAVAGLLSRTRTWAALGSALHAVGLTKGSERDQRTRLADEADTLLEHFGPEIYERDDELAAHVREHYELSLRRTHAIAAGAGAEVLFVLPASNLKDCSPFKSEPTDRLGEGERERSRALLELAVRQARDSLWTDALATLDEAISLDPRHAELHYRRGRVLLALGAEDEREAAPGPPPEMALRRYAEAETALRRALDEDVCPLRLLSSMEPIVARVATDTDSPLIDFPELLREVARKRWGHPILGQELFLDHVHPTIEANRLLAVRIVEELITRGVVRPSPGWGAPAVAEAERIVEARMDPARRARGLANLGNVLAWAGKTEDAVRPATEALATGVNDPEIVLSAASILSTHYAEIGDREEEIRYRRMALHAAPASPELHFKIGLRLLDQDPPDREGAIGHIFLASVFWEGPNRDEPHRMIARLMAERGRYAAGLSHVLEAQKVRPGHPETHALLGELGRRAGPAADRAVPPLIDVQRYPSGALHRVVQVRPGPGDRYVPDVLWTEWYEGGEIQRFVDYADGLADGIEVRWDPDGRVLSRTRYRAGQTVTDR